MFQKELLDDFQNELLGNFLIEELKEDSQKEVFEN